MTSPTAAPRLLVQLRHAIRLNHYSPPDWVRRFVRFNGMRHPVELGVLDAMVMLQYSAGLAPAPEQSTTS